VRKEHGSTKKKYLNSDKIYIIYEAKIKRRVLKQLIRNGKNYLNYSKSKVRQIFGKLSIEEMDKENAIKHGTSTTIEIKRIEIKEAKKGQSL